MQPGCWRWKISLSLSIGACNSLIPDIYRVVELFAGAGGLALGFEQAGLKSVLLNEIDRYACATLRHNRPDWRVIEGDVAQLSFQQLYSEKVDIVAGGFPCQAFSYSGKKLGFNDTRGTLFFEFARAVQELPESSRKALCLQARDIRRAICRLLVKRNQQAQRLGVWQA
jgi:tRNA G37 N-methylase Trm5